MPTRTSFIGLILLIAALLVASVPQLLTPTADGVERLAVRTGMLDEERPPKRTRSEPEDEQPAPGKLADPALTLRGHAVEEDGDLRDTVEVAERAATSRGRLAAGTTRRPLPGALVEADRALPPASIEDGVLLDVAGCPMFRPGTDVPTLLADLNVQDRYLGKVADSDDPDACEPLYQQRVEEAVRAAQAADAPAGAVAREQAAIRRGGRSAMIIALSEIQLLSQIMDDDELRESLAELER